MKVFVFCSKLLQNVGGTFNSAQIDEWARICFKIHSSFLSDDEAYLGLSSSILLMKSGFSRHPSQVSSQSLRIFFKSRTFSFFRSTVPQSICLSKKEFISSCFRELDDPLVLTKFKITNLIIFLLELFANFIGWHRPADWL